MPEVGAQRDDVGGDDRAAGIEELQSRLRESVRRLEETQTLARVGSWEWDIPPLQSTWSKEMLRIFGRDPDGPPPTLDELIAAVHPDDRAGFRELVERVRQTPGRFQHRYRIIDADGEVHHLQAVGRTVLDAEGRPTRSFGTTQDITELRRSEMQLERAQRLEAVGQLAGGIAHDFNNLLSVILNHAECLMGEAGEDEAMPGLREIERAALTAADLTRHLLLFSRRETTDLRPIDLVAALCEAEALLRPTIGEQIEISLEAPAGLPPVGLGVGQAEQILINLAVNARDAMPQGGRIAISVRELNIDASAGDPVSDSSPGAPHLVLSVADEGVGMSAETAAQAFDPFFTTKSRDKGTGLGLATVYGIVSQAGGQIEIESEPGKGTVVNVYLPVVAGGEGDPKPVPALPPPARGQTVLVVDNEQAVRTVVCRMLERHGYRAVHAAGGAEAEVILAGGRDVDLLLTDMVMPGMSGGELVGRLHSQNPSLPAIYMSGFAGGGTSQQALGRDATFLEKPFTGRQLIAAVDEILARG
jgi:two-component system, cell cycle sensor histidine kinase and response regulator CckA